MKKLLLAMVVFLATTAWAQSNYQDVVYLKNGSIIRGIIVEQIPNESLKIETADGNIFVYKLGDVEKITKENSVASPKTQSVPQEQKEADPQSVLQKISQSHQWGVKGGLGVAKQTVDGESTNSRTGIYLGFLVEVPISTKVSFQPELLYSMQGCSYKSGSITVTEKTDYINIPLMFKIYVWKQRLSIDAGPQFGYMISAKYSRDGNTTDFYDRDWLNKFDVSIGVGASYKLTDNFDVNWRINLGVTDISKNTDHRNSVYQLGVGYRF